MKKKDVRTASVVLECLGLIGIGVGVGCEITVGGDLYLIVITACSAMVATGGMIWAKWGR